MTAQGPGWLDEPGHAEPVELDQAIKEWAAANPHEELSHARLDDELEPEWDSQDSNAYQDRVEAGEIEEDEPEPDEYDPGPEVDDEGGMSEYRHAAEWQDVDRAEIEAAS